MTKRLRNILTQVVEDAAEYFPAGDTQWTLVEEFINKNYAPTGWRIVRDQTGWYELQPNDTAAWAGKAVVFARPYKSRIVVVRVSTQADEQGGVICC